MYWSCPFGLATEATIAIGFPLSTLLLVEIPALISAIEGTTSNPAGINHSPTFCAVSQRGAYFGHSVSLDQLSWSTAGKSNGLILLLVLLALGDVLRAAAAFNKALDRSGCYHDASTDFDLFKHFIFYEVPNMVVTHVSKHPSRILNAVGHLVRSRLLSDIQHFYLH